MSKTKIRFLVYNAFGIGGTVKTVFNFAEYFHKTGQYSVEIISAKQTRDTPTLPLHPGIKISVIQDCRRGAKFTKEEQQLLSLPSTLIHLEEDLFSLFNRYTDIRILERIKNMKDGVLVTTIPSFNMLAAKYADRRVLCIGQEHKSFADHSAGIQDMIRQYYPCLDALTILTKKNLPIYADQIGKGRLPVYVIGNGTKKCHMWLL